jgi:hypothetical protein
VKHFRAQLKHYEITQHNIKDYPMLNKRAFLTIIGAAFITTACTAPASDVKGEGLVSKGYQISDVTVVLAKGAAVGRFEKDPALAKKTVQSINSALTAGLVKSAPELKKAKLNVEITRMELRSAGGRTLAAVENQIVGNVVAKDSAGQIVMAQQITFSHKGSQNQMTYNGIPVGLLFSAAANAGTSGSGDDVKIIVDGFDNKVLALVAK